VLARPIQRLKAALKRRPRARPLVPRAAALAQPRARVRCSKTKTEPAATKRRHAHSTPRGSLEVRARIRRARMRVAMTGSTPRLEDAATPPHASKEPVATDADASSQSTT
jgi:hypothetical protein